MFSVSGFQTYISKYGFFGPLDFSRSLSETRGYESDNIHFECYYLDRYFYSTNNLRKTDRDGMTNMEEYTYKMDHSLYDAVTKSILASNSTTYLISVQYLPNGIYWNGTIPNNPDTDQDGLKDGYEVSHTYSSSHKECFL